MPAAYKVIWSPKAKLTYFSIIEYLDGNWTEKEIKSFVVRTEEIINHISQFPEHFPYTKANDTFKCVLIPQISLFYRLRQSQIELLIFWDNRQNPAKLLLL